MTFKFTKPQLTKLLKNGATDFTGDHVPVVKLFNPCGAGTWLLTALDGDIAWCVADLGMDCVEAGTVSISELQSIKGLLGLGIERDKWFKADKPYSHYLQQDHL